MPFYRTFLFKAIADDDDDAAMIGDPTPERWLMSSFIHWTAFALIISCLHLRPLSSSKVKIKDEKDNRKKMQ